MKAKTWAIPGPWTPPEWEPADASAFQALQRGEASPEQQQRALKWLVEVGAGTYELSYRPDSDRETAFAEGRRFVGLQVVKLLVLNVGLITNRREHA